jgi:hypothetical protein
VRYIGVGRWRIGHQELKQSLPASGQVGERIANDLSALVGKKALVDLRLVGNDAFELDLIMAEHDSFTRRQGAQALIPRGRR